MSVATFEAIVENGRIRLPQEIHLPENAVVYVVVPDYPAANDEPEATLAGISFLVSPRLKRPEQAIDFTLEVVEESGHAALQ